ncbi:hypothetical protein [Paludisphaera sp.]|uniref:hypothetical protein n=1 Tax=Paludisphaera sp. TaxID=2017432 RepID=UPI00301B8AAE
MKVRDWSGAARYGLPGLILGAAVAWAGGARAPELSAQTAGEQPPAARLTPPRGDRPAGTGGASDMIALLSANPQGTPGAQFLFLVDAKSQALAVYRFDPNAPKGSLKLEAARRYEWDLKLDQYNNQAPEPGAIEASLKAAQPGRTPRDR